MKDTGERHIIGDSFMDWSQYYNHLMHVETYRYAKRYCEGKRVLDYGCGSGYGVRLLSEVATEVVGTDVSDEAVDYARNQYTARNVCFKNISAIDEALFDVVTSFQVIEHVDNVHQYLKGIKQHLLPQGTVLISTPNRVNRLFRWQKPWNPFHVKEYTAEELKLVLEKHFEKVDILHITSKGDLYKHEIQRTKKQKLVTLPATLGFYPNGLRIFLLSLLSKTFHFLKKIQSINSSSNTSAPPQKISPPKDIDTIIFTPNAKCSTDLFAVCRNKK